MTWMNADTTKWETNLGPAGRRSGQLDRVFSAFAKKLHAKSFAPRHPSNSCWLMRLIFAPKAFSRSSMRSYPRSMW